MASAQRWTASSISGSEMVRGGVKQDESETPEDAREELSAADILEGDVISVSLDQKGRASEILVISQAKSRGAGIKRRGCCRMRKAISEKDI